jgi:hypothetical protein
MYFSEEMVKEATKEDDDARVGCAAENKYFVTCLVDERS